MTKDQECITKHFAELVEKYAGKYVAVVNRTVVSIGGSAKKVEEEAKKKCKVEIPSVLLVPHKEDLLHVL